MGGSNYFPVHFMYAAHMEEEAELAWAAGLLVGEGWVGKVYSPKPYVYIHLAVTMCDQRAIERFVRALGLPKVHGPFHQDREDAERKPVYRAAVSGRTAELALGRLWPWIKDTDKGDQALVVAEELGLVPWVTGEITTPRPRGNRHDQTQVRRG